jgi:hypothetical protein
MKETVTRHKIIITTIIAVIIIISILGSRIEKSEQSPE